MNSAVVDFQTRSREVESYFRFVLRLVDEGVVVQKSHESEPAVSQYEHEELLKTLKATCYLLLYNLVESTMRNAVEAIYEELRLRQALYDDCREELRREILRNFKKRDMDKLLPKLLMLARDVVHETFERSEAFAGNLDARTIKSTAKKFGFTEPSDGKYWMLQAVKDARNDLAHGNKSFAEVGRDALPTDLEKARMQAVEILTETLTNIGNYIARQDYLARTPETVAINT